MKRQELGRKTPTMTQAQPHRHGEDLPRHDRAAGNDLSAGTRKLEEMSALVKVGTDTNSMPAGDWFQHRSQLSGSPILYLNYSIR